MKPSSVPSTITLEEIITRAQNRITMMDPDFQKDFEVERLRAQARAENSRAAVYRWFAVGMLLIGIGWLVWACRDILFGIGYH